MHVVQRDPSNSHLTRIHHVRPSDGEIFYLRCILQREPVSSFTAARTVDATIHPTFQDAARAKGLFSDHSESSLTLAEAVECLYTPRQLRALFADLLVNDCMEFPLQTWETFAYPASYDFYLRHGHSDAIARNYALSEIQAIIHEHARNLNDFGLPIPDLPDNHESMSDLEQWSSNPALLRDRAQTTYSRLNAEQRQVYDMILDSVAAHSSLRLFIEGRAGTGKTTVITTLCDALRAQGLIILPTATSAFAAQLYLGGRTTHSTFKASLPLFSPLSTFQ